MHNFPPRIATGKAFIAIALSNLIIFLAIGVAAQSPDKSDWKQWTTKDIHQILSNSPWVSYCPAVPGYIAVLVSSHTVREALVRNVQLDKRYDKLDPARLREADQRADACLNERFDNYIVISFSFLPDNSQVARKVGGIAPENISIATSDGRKITGHLVPESVAVACGGFPQDSYVASLWPLWSSMLWQPLGPGKEVAFPRFVDGKPTILPMDKTIRIHLDVQNVREPLPADYYTIDFNIDKLTYQGKLDF